MSRRAVFLDRDGTIIRDAGYVRRPEDVELLPGAARAIARLNGAGIPVVVVTNQSGIARGYFAAADNERVQQRVVELLAAEGARIDATYVCPHHPDFTGPCNCRKPGTELFERAAREMGLSNKGSWYIGDRLRDVQPALTLGGSGIFVPSHATPASELETAMKEFEVVASLDDAVTRVIRSS